MSTPLSAAGGRRGDSESYAWQELEDTFARLGQLARSAVAPQEFYRSLLEESIRALSALGGAVWLRAPGGTLQPLVQVGWPSGQFAGNEASRRAHELLLADAAKADRVVSVTPHSGDLRDEKVNPTEHILLLAPVNMHPGEGPGQQTLTRKVHPRTREATSTLAIIELLFPSGASPGTQHGWEQFLTAVCDVAADFHTLDDLHRLRQDEGYRGQLLGLGRDAHRHLNLQQTAYSVANDGRRVIGCDRLSVLAARGRRARLLATSGVSRPERRSGVARRLEQLADLVRRTNEPAFYLDGQSDALPPVASALEQHAEESHARQVAAIPLRPPAELREDEPPISRHAADSSPAAAVCRGG